MTKYPLIHRRRDDGPPSPQSSAKPSGRRLVGKKKTAERRSTFSTKLGKAERAKVVIFRFFGSPESACSHRTTPEKQKQRCQKTTPFLWQGRRDSNTQPMVLETTTLPLSHSPMFSFCNLLLRKPQITGYSVQYLSIIVKRNYFNFKKKERFNNENSYDLYRRSLFM